MPTMSLEKDAVATTLGDLQPGEKAVIKRFLSEDSAFLRFRELGLLPGTPVVLVRRAPLGDPIEFNVRGSLLSVRQHEAVQIEIEA